MCYLVSMDHNGTAGDVTRSECGGSYEVLLFTAMADTDGCGMLWSGDVRSVREMKPIVKYLFLVDVLFWGGWGGVI